MAITSKRCAFQIESPLCRMRLAAPVTASVASKLLTSSGVWTRFACCHFRSGPATTLGRGNLRCVRRTCEPVGRTEDGREDSGPTIAEQRTDMVKNCKDKTDRFIGRGVNNQRSGRTEESRFPARQCGAPVHERARTRWARCEQRQADQLRCSRRPFDAAATVTTSCRGVGIVVGPDFSCKQFHRYQVQRQKDE